MPPHMEPPPELLATPGAGEGGSPSSSVHSPHVLLESPVEGEGMLTNFTLPQLRAPVGDLAMLLERGEGGAVEPAGTAL